MTAAQTPVLASCQCGDDPELQLLRDLITNDLDQWNASLIAFGHPPKPDAPQWAQLLWARLEARRIANRTRADLCMPLLPLRLEPSDLVRRDRIQVREAIKGGRLLTAVARRLQRLALDMIEAGVAKDLPDAIRQLRNAHRRPIKIPIQRTGP